jgi:LacI family transcriptional regulator
MTRKPPATLRDVATRAGVSLTTASLVLNGKRLDRFPDATRLNVLGAATTLGYRANTPARSLRSRFVNSLAISVALEVNRPFVSELLAGATEAAFSHGQALLLFPGDRSLVADAALDLLDTRRADGLVLDGLDGLDAHHLDDLARRLVVVQDRILPLPSNVKAVLLNNDAGRAAVMAHLTSLGHTSIGYLSPSRQTGVRLASYRNGLLAAGVAPRHELVAFAEPTIDAAARAAEQLLAGSSRPTAVVCANDVFAAGAYQTAARFGLQIPGDLSVASFASFAVAPALQPQLTAVLTPAQAAGGECIKLLLALLHGEPCETIVLPSPLGVRGSTAEPRRLRETT